MALVASLGLLLASGCGGNPSSPEDVAASYADALLNGDLKKANKLSTARTESANAFLITMISQQKEQNPDEVKAVGKVKETVVDGDKATVYFEDGTSSVTLVKVDGDWKVDMKK